MPSLLIETLTPVEISKMLRIHPLSVTRLARQGKIPAMKVGGVWRFRKDQFMRWINARSKGGDHAAGRCVITEAELRTFKPRPTGRVRKRRNQK